MVHVNYHSHKGQHLRFPSRTLLRASFASNFLTFCHSAFKCCLFSSKATHMHAGVDIRQKKNIYETRAPFLPSFSCTSHVPIVGTFSHGQGSIQAHWPSCCYVALYTPRYNALRTDFYHCQHNLFYFICVTGALLWHLVQIAYLAFVPHMHHWALAMHDHDVDSLVVLLWTSFSSY